MPQSLAIHGFSSAEISNFNSVHECFQQQIYSGLFLLRLRHLPGTATIFISGWFQHSLYRSHVLFPGATPSSPLNVAPDWHLCLCVCLTSRNSFSVDCASEYSAFWKPFIPTTVMYIVFHLFALYDNLYTLCFIKKPIKAQHSLTSPRI